MEKKFNNIKNTSLLLGLMGLIIFAQALIIARCISEKNNKKYEVNLVAINTKKDSIDYPKMRGDLLKLDDVVRQIHRFLITKNIQDPNIEVLSQDSLSSSVYLAKQSNRYSQYLVDLQNKLQQLPIGMPTDGYISSNFGNRKNPIPFKTKKNVEPKAIKTDIPAPQIIEEKDSLGNVTKRTVAPTTPIVVKNQPKEINNPPAEADQIQFHKGLDIAVPYGSEVRCTAAGTVIFAGPKGGYGNCIIISHGNGLDTLYGHLSQILISTGDLVKVGQIIGKSGNTGRSTGPHLHYEVHKNGSPVNPKLFLNF